MRVGYFKDVTRVTLVGKNGLVYEDYNLMKDGAEIHVQDQGRTLKVFPWDGVESVNAEEPEPPTKRTLVGRLGQMQLRNPWTWPVIVLSVLLIVVLVGTVLALLSGCAAQRGSSGGGSVDTGSVQQGTGNTDFTEHTITLSDGRTVTCLTWDAWDFMTETMRSGMDCLEPGSE